MGLFFVLPRISNTIAPALMRRCLTGVERILFPVYLYIKDFYILGAIHGFLLYHHQEIIYNLINNLIFLTSNVMYKKIPF